MTSAYERGNIPEIQLHHRLRIAREYAQLEQSELADRMGISRTSVSAAESGRKSPRRITLNAWALACGVPLFPPKLYTRYVWCTVGDMSTQTAQTTTTHVLRWQQNEIVDDGYSILDKLSDHRNWSGDAETCTSYNVYLIAVGVDEAGEPTEDDVDDDGFTDRDADPETAEPYTAAEDRLLSKYGIDRANVTVEQPW